MASLVGWLGNAAKRVENTVHNDVVKPIQRDVVRPVSRVVAQINPADNNRTFKNPQGNSNNTPGVPLRAAPSAIQQLTHNGATNVAGSIAKPIVRAPINIYSTVANPIYNHAVAPVFHLPQQTPQQVFDNNPNLRRFTQPLGANGSLHQTVGDTAQLALTAATGGISRGVEAGAAKVIPKFAPSVVKALVPKVASNAVIGAGFGATSAAGDGASLKDIKKSAELGAAMGGAIPVAGAAAKKALPVVAKGIQKAPVAIKQVANPENPGVAAIRQTNQQLQKKFDNTADKTARRQISQQIARNNQEISKIKQGGYARIPNKGSVNDPAPDLHHTQKEFINDYAEMLQGMDAGNGVSIMPDGTRATSNSPFYRATYAEKGRAPTKEEWFNQARHEIESGKAAFGASEDYKKLAVPSSPQPPVSSPQLNGRTTSGKNQSGVPSSGSIPESTLYHGSPQGTAFDPSKIGSGNRGQGIYLTDNAEAAKYHSYLNDQRAQNTALRGNPDLSVQPTARLGNVSKLSVAKDAKIARLDHPPTEAKLTALKQQGYHGASFAEDLYKSAQDIPHNLVDAGKMNGAKTTVMFDGSKLNASNAIDPLAALKQEAPNLEPAMNYVKGKSLQEFNNFLITGGGSASKSRIIQEINKQYGNTENFWRAMNGKEPKVSFSSGKLGLNSQPFVKSSGISNPADPLTQLKQEALKYKSAGEFASSMGHAYGPAGSNRTIVRGRFDMPDNFGNNSQEFADLYNQAHAEANRGTPNVPRTAGEYAQSLGLPAGSAVTRSGGEYTGISRKPGTKNGIITVKASSEAEIVAKLKWLNTTAPKTASKVSTPASRPPQTKPQTIANLAKLETVPPTPAQIVEPRQAAPSQPFDANQYIAEQTKLQEAAHGKANPLQALRKEVSTKMIDSLTPIEKPVEQALGRSGSLPLRNQLDRSLRADTIGGQFAKDNGLHNIINSVPDTKAFDQYLIAKHAQDLEANGVKTGRNLAADKHLVGQLAPQHEAAAKALAGYNNKLLDQTVKYGLISKETAQYLKQKYPNYVPFDRIFTDAEMAAQHSGTGSGPASLSTQTVIQKIKGSDRQISSPLENILAKTHDVTAQGERNLAAKHVASMAKLPGNPLGLKELKPNETIGNRPTISFLDNGQKRTFETTPEVAAAAKSLNKEQLGLITKIMRYPTRALRLGATGINVGFTAANVVKDIATGALNSEHPMRASVANPKVFVDALAASFWHGGKNYAELTRQGAGGTSFDIARSAAPDTIAKIRADRNVGFKALYTVRHPGELVRAVENTIGRSEEFGRSLQYFGNKQAALKAGKSLTDATMYGADAARNNTTNFARAGEYGRVLNSVLPYFNAGIQGSRTLVRNVKNRPAQTVSKLVVGSFVPIATVTAWNLNDPARKQAYDDIPDYEKQGNIIIVPPHPHKDPATGRWNVIKIPVSQEVANANGIVRNGIESLHKDANFNFAQMAANLTGTATSLNVGSTRQVLNQVTPQAIKPAVELATNQNLFTGNKVVPDSKKNLAPQDQYGDGTSGSAKVLGRLTKTSPYQIDNAIKTSFAGAGQNAVNATDRLLAATHTIKPSEVRGKSVDSGITGRFYGAAGGSGYSNADKTFADAQKKLLSNPNFQKLSQADRAKELNRLKTDITNTEVRKYDAKYQTGQYSTTNPTPQTKLSKNQMTILQNGLNLNDYTKTSAEKAAVAGGKSIDVSAKLPEPSKKVLTDYNSLNADDRKAKIRSQNDYEYKVLQAKYDNDVANKAINPIKASTRQQEVAKAKVGSSYSKDVRDLYSLSKDKTYDYITKTPGGQKLGNDLIAYDQALYDAGLTKYKKYSNGLAPATKSRTASGTKSRSSKGSKASKSVAKAGNYKLPKLSTPKYKTPHLKSAGKVALKTPSMKKYQTKNIAVKSKTPNLHRLLSVA